MNDDGGMFEDVLGIQSKIYQRHGHGRNHEITRRKKGMENCDVFMECRRILGT